MAHTAHQGRVFVENPPDEAFGVGKTVLNPSLHLPRHHVLSRPPIGRSTSRGGKRLFPSLPSLGWARGAHRCLRQRRRTAGVRWLINLSGISIRSRAMPGFFKCEQCSYSSNSSSNLYSHKKSHLRKQHPRANTLFSCKVCTFVGTSSGSLQKHMKRHGEVGEK